MMIKVQSWCLAMALSTGAAAADAQMTFVPSGGQAPLSKAVRVDNVLYLSGQIGIGPDGKLADGIEAQTKQTLDNIGATLAAQGLTFDDVFKCTVFLADMGTWGRFNTVYATYFKRERLPARSAVGVNALAAGAALELECTAAVPRDAAK